jgi:hypothetical protein
MYNNDMSNDLRLLVVKSGVDSVLMDDSCRFADGAGIFGIGGDMLNCRLSPNYSYELIALFFGQPRSQTRCSTSTRRRRNKEGDGGVDEKSHDTK